MSIGVTEDHRALQDAVRGWATRYSPVEVVRDGYEDEAPALPSCWGPLGEQGFLGTHPFDGYAGRVSHGLGQGQLFRRG